MDTKSKNKRIYRTAHTAVRIMCFILIPALSFVILSIGYTYLSRQDDTGVNPEIVLADLSTNQYFYDQHMGRTLYHAHQALMYVSVESIEAGEHLRWVPIEAQAGGYYDSDRIPQSSSQDSPQDSSQDSPQTSSQGSPQVFPPYNWYYGYELKDIHRGNSFGVIHQWYDIAGREALEQAAKLSQINDLNTSLTYLSGEKGLVYSLHNYISSGAEPPGAETPGANTPGAEPPGMDSPGAETPSLNPPGTNSPGTDSTGAANSSDAFQTDGYILDFSNVVPPSRTPYLFKSYQVYFIYNPNTGVESSSRSDSGSSSPYVYSSSSFYYAQDIQRMDNAALYLAYSAEVVSAQNMVYTTARNAYITDLSVIAGAFLMILALTVILLLGAGRKRNEIGVHFALIDKPYLDISLAILLGWVAVLYLIGENVVELVSYHRNGAALNIIFAVAVIAVVPPALIWLASLTKRIKAGRFWRHALIYAFPCWLIRSVIRLCKSLWAGMRLMLKVGLISFISFCIMVTVGIVGYATGYNTDGFLVPITAFVFTALVTFCLLRYARRIQRLEQGAADASIGVFDRQIDAGGGELGRIAGSINSISSGLTAAVEQRIKSERLKTELITNVSHDIRTPLTSIITYTDLLKREGLDCEKAPEYLDILIQKSQRLKTLTDELFEASKAASGNIDVNVTELDLVSLINQVLGELDSAIKSSGLDLRVGLPERMPVRADGRLMWRVLENLMSNVFKYSLPGSRVYLTVTADGPVSAPGNVRDDAPVSVHNGDSGNAYGNSPGNIHANAPGIAHGITHGNASADTHADTHGKNPAAYSAGATPSPAGFYQYMPGFARLEIKNISAAELNVDPAELTERFKRGDSSRADGGSGLGLSIVQSFVNAQGGKFEIAIDGDLYKATVSLPRV